MKWAELTYPEKTVAIVLATLALAGTVALLWTILFLIGAFFLSLVNAFINFWRWLG